MYPRRLRRSTDRYLLWALGRRLRALRHECDLTQKDVGEHLGLYAGTVSYWERGESAPDVLELYRLARLLQCSPEFLLTGEEPRPPHANPWLRVGPAWGQPLLEREESATR